MRILYISHKPIFPKIDGGCVAMANFLELLLANNHVVKHLTIETHKHPFKISNYPSDITAKILPEAIRIDTDVKFSKALPYLFKNGSYNVQRFHARAMEVKIVETLNSTEFDVVILESLFSTPYLKVIQSNFHGKVYLRSHNIEFKIWEDIKNNSSNPLKKVYLNKLFKDIKKYEIETLSNIDGILTISEADANFYRSLSTIPIETISLALSNNQTLENDFSGTDIFHLGGMNWEPNKEAVKRLIRLFPSIKESVSTLKLHIIGKGTDRLAEKCDDSILFEGFVDHIDTHCTEIGILVTPIVSGSGIRIKILEMMALGIPVITTTKGAQGIDVTNHKCLVIADSDDEIIAACIHLVLNKNERMELGAKAKSYISKFHSISISSEKLNAFLGAK